MASGTIKNDLVNIGKYTWIDYLSGGALNTEVTKTISATLTNYRFLFICLVRSSSNRLTKYSSSLIPVSLITAVSNVSYSILMPQQMGTLKWNGNQFVLSCTITASDWVNMGGIEIYGIS